MDHVVAKEFKTVNGKFAVDAPISEADIHPETHLSFADYKKRGFIAEVKAPAALPKVSPVTVDDKHDA
jgi:hypothetical protein